MSTESVELETVEVNETKPTSDADIAGFNWEEYQEYFTPVTADDLVVQLRDQKRGWKTSARYLMKIHNAQTYADRLKQELEDYITSERKPAGPRKLSQVDHLRIYLTGLSDNHLETLCTEFDVSYSSFMKTNDRTGMIESLIDQMPSA